MTQGPYRERIPRLEPPPWRWAAYAFCVLLTGIPAGVSARAAAAYAYGCASRPARCRERVEKISFNNYVTCDPGATLELDKAEQTATCRCPKVP